MSTPTYDNLILDRADGVARITMDSTSEYNALNAELAEELLDVSSYLAEADVRCIVLTGSGDAFCAGADVGMLEGTADDAVLIRRITAIAHEAIVQLHQASAPVIVGVNGVAAGAGFSFSLLGDLTVVSSAARLEYAYPQLGLTGDAAATYFLPRRVGLQRAKKIVLLNEPIDPEQAVDMGLAAEVVPDEEFETRLTSLATDIASGPTVALDALSGLLTRSFERSLEEQLSSELDALAAAFNTDDYGRGFEAYLAGEEPQFAGE
ncbi:enoyl-CoA hydratase/isomerase family protein [Natronomonas marina]|jgi:2-(1,2-epoxy-1,2-dihydrophenyl)acetyl-CoA isomerase|uniref:enoyl-CoA hydratase/isomerase family protein n=1 Tax=Natronomonas marina TaxID=2961939 RepID=UPI0020C9D8B5|nr:enoyl-CoA hydratase/isomerase family protein [Natronomonas marina]